MERYRIGPGTAVYFVTFSIVEWLPVFVSESACGIVTDSLNYCHQHKSLRTNGYVIMPTHFHAIVFDADGRPDRLRQSLTDFRKFTGRSLLDHCETHAPKCFRDVFKAAAPEDRERRFWQRSWHPEGIEAEAFWKQKLDYLHANPCRKGLTRRGSEWRFSSAAWYVSDCAVPNDVVLSPIEW